MKTSPVRTAVIGIGGFASQHHGALRKLEDKGVVKVVAACDPSADRLAEKIAMHDFAGRGVAVYDDVSPLLEQHGATLDMVTAASPIRHHAEHHRLCVERGLACYLEKPPTLDPDELERMIATERQARFRTRVGFNYISQPQRQRIKERVLSGEFGRLRRVSFMGLWRRSLAYYGRNQWAGRLMLDDGYLLLDSCCGNAMAHYVHNLLFHAGSGGLFSWAAPAAVEAELYRANDIEGADTVLARGTLENGVEFSLSASHACANDGRTLEIIECDRARIEISERDEAVITVSGGGRETFGTDAGGSRLEPNLADFAGYVAGGQENRATTLPDTRAFVRLNALLYLAAGGIGNLPRAVFRAAGESVDTVIAPEIERVCEEFIVSGRFPSEQKLPWARRGGRAVPADLPDLRAFITSRRKNL